ncbi:uncharacterized protein METZ01_LOCUS1162 [marine metagenome]|uniref:Uncharacterized protein n=1 Tax=marine metagenome TaxID=408172 RepID=A0A381N3S3_9ZZZZ
MIAHLTVFEEDMNIPPGTYQCLKKRGA